MEYDDCITETRERKKGEHLQPEDRGKIQVLRRRGCSLREIAAEVNCSPSTVSYELKRGTPPRKGNRGRAPGYSAKRGQAVYKRNRQRCVKAHKIDQCQPFSNWVAKQVRKHKWSLDASVGRAKLLGLFKQEEMVCTKTLYNELAAGNLPLSLFEVPQVLKRKKNKPKNRVNKRPKGRSIEERPSIVNDRIELGHWEVDTVVGHRQGKEAVVLSLVERVTDNYIALHIPGRTSDAVMTAITALNMATSSARSSRASPQTMVLSLKTSPYRNNGVPWSTLTTRIPLGSGPKTNDITVSCVGLSQKVFPWNAIRHKMCFSLQTR